MTAIRKRWVAGLNILVLHKVDAAHVQCRVVRGFCNNLLRPKKYSTSSQVINTDSASEASSLSSSSISYTNHTAQLLTATGSNLRTGSQSPLSNDGLGHKNLDLNFLSVSIFPQYFSTLRQVPFWRGSREHPAKHVRSSIAPALSKLRIPASFAEWV